MLWGYIGELRAWHVYTKKSAKHDGGILTARPICGQSAFMRGASSKCQLSQLSVTRFTQDHPPVNSPHTICRKCRQKWDRRKGSQ